jgi:hypothetical protein
MSQWRLSSGVGCAFQFASEELKGDRDIAMEVVKRQRFALEMPCLSLRGQV